MLFACLFCVLSLSAQAQSLTLHEVAQVGDFPAYKELVESGTVDLDEQRSDGCTALMLAAFAGHEMARRYSAAQILGSLLRLGANPDLVDDAGNTALIYAAMRGNTPEVLDLAGWGETDATIQNNDGNTASDLARRNRHTQIVEFLFVVPLFKHVEADDLQRVQGFLTTNIHHPDCDVNTRNADHHTVLHIAARDGHAEIVQVLVDADADVNLQANGGWPLGGKEVNESYTPLMYAAEKKHADVVRILLDADADVAIGTSEAAVPGEKTALHMAAGSGSVEIINLLLDAGAAIDEQDGFGRTPLVYAVLFQRRKAVEHLIIAGADVNLCTHRGETPLMRAAAYNLDEVVRLLLEAGASIDLQTSEPIGLVDSNWGKNRFSILPIGITALMFAVVDADVIVAHRLLAAGADITISNSEGDTALSLANRLGLTEILDLLEAAVNENLPDVPDVPDVPPLDNTKDAMLSSSSDLRVSFYPNPVAEMLHITSLEAAVLYLYNVSGVLVDEHQIVAGVNVVSFVAYAADTYLLRMLYADGEVVRRIVKQ